MSTSTTPPTEHYSQVLLSSAEYGYIEALREILASGVKDTDRTGTGTISRPGVSIVQEAEESIIGMSPHFYTKYVHLPAIIHELLWMISGDTNIKYLKDNNVNIWNEWADESGDLGPVYGKQWRNCDGIDQLQKAIDLLRTDPSSRRIIVNSWNPRDLEDMALTPCHCMFQFISKPMDDNIKSKLLESYPEHEVAKAASKRFLHIEMTQRSGDMFLGVPFNILFYFILMNLVAHITGHNPGQLRVNIGDAHIYLNHLDQVEEQMTRLLSLNYDEINDDSLIINSRFFIPNDCPAKEIGDFTYDMVRSFFGKYLHMGKISAPISV